MATLIILVDGEESRVELNRPEVVLGRHPDCEVQVNSNMVSRRHARMWQEGDEYRIEDLGSGNGTFLNGKKLEGPGVVKHDDRIKLGPILIRLDAPELGGGRKSGGAANLGATLAVDIASGEADAATIMGTLDKSSGFGALDVRPEAKLKAVLEISRSLAGQVDLEELLPRILDTLFNIFPHADRACILFRDDAGKFIPRAIKHRRAGDDESVKLSRTILNAVLEQKTGILSADAASDSRFQGSESISNLTIRSMMCVPMLTLDEEVAGIINIDTQSAFNQFRKEDLDLLMAVAGQAALSYESAKLLITALEKQKQDREMAIATNVQRALLPECLPEVAGYEFYASYDSAQAVGGDYYDCLKLDDDRVVLAFGDVAGKGVPASLVMSRISSVVQNVVQFVHDVGEAAARINNQMCAKAVEGRFVTFILAVIQTKTGRMKLVNAGHMPIMVRKTDGSIVEIEPDSVGVPLGVMEDYPFDVVDYTIAPGETCVIYTDGVSEAMNPDSDLYGVERLKSLMAAAPQGAAEELGKTILADVRKHANGRAQNDDITIMVFGRGA